MMETIVTNIRNTLNSEPLNVDTQPSPSMNSKDLSDFRRVQMPETKTGLASTETDLIFMVKKYLEIVGLVFFVWLLGE